MDYSLGWLQNIPNFERSVQMKTTEGHENVFNNYTAAGLFVLGEDNVIECNSVNHCYVFGVGHHVGIESTYGPSFFEGSMIIGHYGTSIRDNGYGSSMFAIGNGTSYSRKNAFSFIDYGDGSVGLEGNTNQNGPMFITGDSEYGIYIRDRYTSTLYPRCYIRIGVGDNDIHFGNQSGEISLSQIINHITCLKWDTKILMADGSEKMIKDVKIGDHVKSYDPKTKELVDTVVLDNQKTGADRGFRCCVFSNGAKLLIKTTHIIYSGSLYYNLGMHDALQLAGKPAFTSEKQAIECVGAVDITYPEYQTRYDIRTANTMYFANGILCTAEGAADNCNYFANRNIKVPAQIGAIWDQNIAEWNWDQQYMDNENYIAESMLIDYEYRKCVQTINAQKKILSDSDYKNFKYAQGELTEEEYLEFTEQCKQARITIRENEARNEELLAQRETIRAKYRPEESRSTQEIWEDGLHRLNENFAIFDAWAQERAEKLGIK